MKYPKFIKKGDTIGICTPSAGVGRKIDDHRQSIKLFNSLGYKVLETASVRVNNKRSAPAKKRAEEFFELTKDPNVDMIMFGTGGDYMLEIMPYINYSELVKNPKWLMGMSDPTNILLDVTCLLDIATIYASNSSSFVLDTPKWQEINLEYLKGNIVKQKSYKKYQTTEDRWNDINDFTHDVKWVSKKPIDIEGRIIGGCFDVMLTHMGTFLDNMANFVGRYADDGIIWYFDVYSKTPLDFYLGLLQMKYAGLFTNCKGVLIGRIAIPNIEDPKFDYQKAADLALGKIPHISEMDIGHTDPYLTIINGAIAQVKCKDGKGEISFKLK